MGKICKYCGREITGKDRVNVCCACTVKHKYVKELVALCQVIKKECGRNE